jgi:prevent-host-death family protein
LDEPLVIGSHVFREQLGGWMEQAAAGREIVVTYRGRPRVRVVPELPPALAPRQELRDVEHLAAGRERGLRLVGGRTAGP